MAALNRNLVLACFLAILLFMMLSTMTQLQRMRTRDCASSTSAGFDRLHAIRPREESEDSESEQSQEEHIQSGVRARYKGAPTRVHTFDSGVKMYKHFFRKAQVVRFAEHNVWEVLDESLITKVLKHGRKGDVFLDCGAALGYYSLLARRLSPEIEIHAFNPHPKFVDRMRQNMELNGFSDIHIHQVAIADRPMHGIKITSAGFGGRIQPNKNGSIDTTTLNEFLPTLKGWKRILLVKADIEGFELKMLEAATDLFGVVQNWVIAIHQTRQECGKVLRRNGYTLIHEDPERVPGEPNGVLVATLKPREFFPGFGVEASNNTDS
eukprot:TRINITY_DN3057_c0_g1_i2.p1 TRINITY_DN3057_c0_g1~~TRINITY_DN3057_c0_g1_i2.p1  ORF type:complete len:323 (+),score=47.57 TRINITY_DN3057_c0_g1_i2:1401-2369(+)